MKRSLGIILVVLVLSVALHATGTAARTTTYLVNFSVNAKKAETEVDTLSKTNYSPERLYLSSYFGRDLRARVQATSGTYQGNSNYAWKLSMGNGFSTHYLGQDPNAAASVYSNFPGTKVTYLKTVWKWPSTTSVSGQWYVNG